METCHILLIIVQKIIVDNINYQDEYIIKQLIKRYPKTNIENIKKDFYIFQKQINKLNINKNNIESIIHIKPNKQSFPIRNATIEIINNCCFFCDHCYISSHTNKISLFYYKKIIDELISINCNEILITGGEPMLHKDFVEMFLYAKKHGFIVSLNTNLFLLNDTILNTLTNYKPRIVEISLYGYDNKSYKQFTHVANSYDIVTKNIDKLLYNGINVGLKSILTQHNKEYIFKLKQYATNLNLPFRYDYIIFPKINSKGFNEERLTPQEIVDVLKQDKDSVAVLKAEVKNYKQNKNEKNELVFQCSIGKDRIFIDSNLELRPCLLVPITYNYKDYSISESMRKFNDFKNKYKISNSNKCLNCSKKILCRYCPGRFFMETGNYQEAPEYFCELANEIIKEFSK